MLCPGLRVLFTKKVTDMIASTITGTDKITLTPKHIRFERWRNESESILLK